MGWNDSTGWRRPVTALSVSRLWKVFGRAPTEALALARDGASKDEILKQTRSVVAVRGVSMSVDPATIFVVMGLSGSGKSTLVRCINRLIEPTAGEILLRDADVTAANPAELRKIRLKRISMVFQHFALLPHKSVLENVEYGLKIRRASVDQRREKAAKALDRVGLSSWASSYPRELSGGMQQRVGLARALAVEPEVLLMDEPFSALDPLIRREVQDELVQLQRELGMTIVFITHDLHEALKLGDQIAIMRDGAFVQVGSRKEIVAEPRDDYVKAFTRDVDRSRVLRVGDLMTSSKALPRSADLEGELARLPPGTEWAAVVDGKRPIGLLNVLAAGAAGNGARMEQLLTAGAGPIKSTDYLNSVLGQLAPGTPAIVVDDGGEVVGLLHPSDVLKSL